ncbi:hypothetical protein EYW48_21195 [Vibrio sp. 1180_3]|nr:hypothetical protein [Vibrio sp. 1180_3]
MGYEYNKQFKWILNAWQFYYASGKVLYGAMPRLSQCVVHHLIGRYVLWRSNEFILKFQNVGAV